MNHALSRTGKTLKLYYVFMAGLILGLAAGIIVEGLIFYLLIHARFPWGG